MSLSDADLEDIDSRIGRKLPATPEEAIASVRDVRLEGASTTGAAFTDKEVGQEFFHGLCETRQAVLENLRQLQDKPPSPGTDPGGSRTPSDRTAALATIRQNFDRISAKQADLLAAIQGGGVRPVYRS